MAPFPDEPISPTEKLSPDAAAAASPEEMLACFESAEHHTSAALSGAGDAIIALSSLMATALGGRGRVITLGAGTSGRIGALDLAEWGPTFGVESPRRVPLIAGGGAAFFEAVEGAEDDGDQASVDLEAIAFSGDDLLIAISASGAAAYVAAGIDHAAAIAAPRALVTSHPRALENRQGLLRVVVETGAEVVQGSTRLKAASAAHRVLQRASTLCALELGWIYRGRMVAMRATNDKLRRRATVIVSDLGEVDSAGAQRLLADAGADIRSAIVSAWFGDSHQAAQQRLAAVGGRLDLLEGQRR